MENLIGNVNASQKVFFSSSLVHNLSFVSQASRNSNERKEIKKKKTWSKIYLLLLFTDHLSVEITGN